MSSKTAETTSSNADDKPWSDVETDFDEEMLERMADDIGRDVDGFIDSMKRSEWLEDQDLETVFEHVTEREIDVDHDTRFEHNVYLRTDFESMPGDIVLEEGFDASIDWIIEIRHALDRYTNYKITNKRLVDGQLVLTLAPEES